MSRAKLIEKIKAVVGYGVINGHEYAQAMELLGELSWTYVDPDDPETLPKAGIPVTAAWTEGFQRVIRKSHFGGQHWYESNSERTLAKFAETTGQQFHVYAWLPWPDAPPLEKVESQEVQR